MSSHTIIVRDLPRRADSTSTQVVATARTSVARRSAKVIARHARDDQFEVGLAPREVARKFWHMVPGALILGLPLVRHYWLFADYLPTLMIACTALLTVVSLVDANHFTRRGERDWSTSVFAYAATALIPLAVVPGHVEIPLTALVILAFGDGAASLAGMSLHGPALPWNGKKTVVGMLAFILCAAPCATWIYWGMSNQRFSFEMALAGGVAATGVAALAESMPSSVNDNIRVGLVATTTLLMMNWLSS